MFNNFKRLKKTPESFTITLLTVGILLIIGIQIPESFAVLTEEINKVLFKFLGDFYLWFVLITLLIFLMIGLSPFGNIRIGGGKAKPEHSYFSWLAMLFCAGMGIGLMYWGAAEPLFHYLNPPVSGTEKDIVNQINAFKISFFHWGLHPWGLYGLTTLAICYFGFNRKKGLLFSSFIFSNNNDSGKIKKFICKATDLFTIIAIFFGIVATFGMGVLQIEGGLNQISNIEPSLFVKIAIIVITTICYMASTLRGLDKGIKVLSNISIILSLFLFGVIFLLLPKEQLIVPLVKAFPEYVRDLFSLSIGALNFTSDQFVREWTVKYWTWWIAWAPFVGIFVALISYGRTIRDIVFSILIIPTMFSTIWLSVFGSAALYTQANSTIFADSLHLADTNLILFKVVEFVSQLPLLTWLSMILIAIFFINSADSATYTLASVSSSDNSMTEEPSKWLQFGWGILFSAMAALFLFTGGIKILQEITLITVVPFTLILVVVYFKLIKKLFEHSKTGTKLIANKNTKNEKTKEACS